MTNPTGKRARIVAGSAIVVATAAAIAVLVRGEATESEQPVFSWSDSGEWMDAMKTATSARFVSRSPSAALRTPAPRTEGVPHAQRERMDPRLEVKSLGPLGPDGVAKARSFMASAVASALASFDEFSRAPGTGPDGEKTLADILEENRRMLDVQRNEACIRALDAGQYWTFSHESGDIDEMRVPIRFLKTKQCRIASIDGVLVDVLYLIDREHDQHVGEYWSAYEAILRAKWAEDARAFNTRPIDDRRQLVEAHFAAVEAIRALRIDELGPSEYRRRVEEVSAGLLGNDFDIDRSLFLLHPRGGR